MDLYEKVVANFSETIGPLPQAQYQWVCFPDAADEDTRSIQAIVQHVVRSGHGYANLMRKSLEQPVFTANLSSLAPDQAIHDLLVMTEATAQTFDGRWDMSERCLETTLVHSHWGPIFNLEQMFEHAIVHVLRHQRQVQRYLQASDP